MREWMGCEWARAGVAGGVLCCIGVCSGGRRVLLQVRVRVVVVFAVAGGYVFCCKYVLVLQWYLQWRARARLAETIVERVASAS